MDDVERTEETPESTKPYRAFKTEDEYRTHLEHVTGERAKRAKEKGVKELLERLELEDEDTLAEVVNDYRTVQEATQTEAQALEEKAQKAERKQRELKEAVQTVEAERDTATERVETLEGLIKGFVSPRVEALEPHYRELLEEWPIERQAKWLTDNADKLGAATPQTGRPAGSRPTGRAQAPPRQEADREARENQRRARVSAI